MKAMLVDGEKNLVWSDVPEPEPKEDEVLVTIKAAAVNRADILQREGKYPSPPGCPPWMGLEIGGVIDKVGKTAAQKSGWKTGDRVCALLGGGGYAQRVCVRHDMLMPVPEGLSLIEAASLPEAFTTVYLNLFYEAQFKPGQVFYMAAGASGLASAAIPMAKSFGAKVITSVLSAEMAKRIEHLGADIIVDTSGERLSEVFKRLEEEGTPVNCAIDCLGGEDVGRCMEHMAPGGYWVIISTLAGIETKIGLRPLLTRGTHLVGSMLRKRSADEKAALLSALVRDVWPKIEAGLIKPTIYKVLPITEADQAHKIMLSGTHVGKLVLTV